MKNERSLDSIIAPYTFNAIGAILFNYISEIKVNKSFVDENGNFIISDLTIEGINLTLTTLYGPNDDKPGFYKPIFPKMAEFDNS